MNQESQQKRIAMSDDLKKLEQRFMKVSAAFIVASNIPETAAEYVESLRQSDDEAEYAYRKVMREMDTDAFMENVLKMALRSIAEDEAKHGEAIPLGASPVSGNGAFHA